LIVCASIIGQGTDAFGVEKSDSDKSSTLVYFSDDFESGLVGWVYSGADWGLTDTEHFSPLHSLTDSPTGVYSPSTDTYITLANSLNLTAAVYPIVTFWHKWDLESGDYGTLEYSTDGGSTWFQLGNWTGHQTSWTFQRINLYVHAGRPDFKIRFHLHADVDINVGDGWYVDDLQIAEREDAIPFPFVEGFEGGLGHWIVNGGDWGVTDEDCFGPAQSLSDSPNRMYDPRLDVYITLAHSIDLTAAAYPVIKFWGKWDIESGDYLSLDYSINGGSTWGVLEIWNTEQSSWTFERVNLYEYAGMSDFKIRLHLHTDDDTYVRDGCHIDEFRIEEREATISYPFIEHFESGLSRWIVNGADWGLTDAWWYVSPNHSLTDSPVGSYLPSLDVYVTLTSSIDLSSAATPVITFWQEWDLETGDYVSLDCSNDGGDTWTSVDSWTADQPAPSYEQISLFEYAGEPDFKIRFHLHTDDDIIVGDGWRVDQVIIGEAVVVGIVDPPAVSSASALFQNRPNPFRQSTAIPFNLAGRAEVTLSIYDATGKLVRTLVSGLVDTGYREKYWDGRDADGNDVVSGVYFCRLTSGNQTMTRKMVLVR
jgi:hypothetical protein